MAKDPPKKLKSTGISVVGGGNNTFDNIEMSGFDVGFSDSSHGTKLTNYKYTGPGNAIELINSIDMKVANVIGIRISNEQRTALIASAKSNDRAGFVSKLKSWVKTITPERIDAVWNIFDKVKDQFG